MLSAKLGIKKKAKHDYLIFSPIFLSASAAIKIIRSPNFK